MSSFYNILNLKRKYKGFGELGRKESEKNTLKVALDERKSSFDGEKNEITNKYEVI